MTDDLFPQGELRHNDTPDDDAPELTDAMLDRAHAFHGHQYLGPARAVVANGWKPVVPVADQSKSLGEVLGLPTPTP